MPVSRRIVRQPWLRLPAVLPLAPSDVSGLFAWYKSNDLATITESGGSVSAWNDKSGNGFHVTQSTGTSQPTTGTRTQNGKNVIDFDGGDLLSTAISGFTGTAATCLIVAKADATGASARFMSMATGQNDWQAGNGGFSVLNQDVDGSQFDGANVVTGLGTGTAVSIVTICRTTSTTWLGRRNGADKSSTTGQPTTAFGQSSLTLGAQFFGGGILDGWIAEVALWNLTLTLPQIYGLELGMNNEWAVY